MAEIRGHDEDGGRVREVGGQELAVGFLGGGGGVADEDGDEGWEGGGVVVVVGGGGGGGVGVEIGKGAREEFVDVGQVHFEAVLVLVGACGHVAEVAGFVQRTDGGEVEGKRAERGGVAGVLGEGEVGEVGVVGGAEEEDAFAVGRVSVFGGRNWQVRLRGEGSEEGGEERRGGGDSRAREIEGFVGPGCGGAGVGVACMSVRPRW